MHLPRLIALVTVLNVTALSIVATAPAAATTPGENGAIAYTGVPGVSGPPDIFIRHSDGSIDNLTQHPAADFDPDWSPDGTRVAFVSRRAGGNRDVWLIDADGTVPTRLTTHPANDFNPRWSPDGSRVLFTSDRLGPRQLFVMDAVDRDADGNGDHLARLTDIGDETDPHVLFAGANWSPDGTAIAFGVLRFAVDGPDCAVFTMRADGTRMRRLTDWKLKAADPDWSPDGTELTFETNACANELSDIVAIRVNGSGLRQLTSGFGNNVTPSWSPDGEHIVFSHTSPTGPPADLAVVEADGSALPTLLTNSSDSNDVLPDWQPLPDVD